MLSAVIVTRPRGETYEARASKAIMRWGEHEDHNAKPGHRRPHNTSRKSHCTIEQSAQAQDEREVDCSENRQLMPRGRARRVVRDIDPMVIRQSEWSPLHPRVWFARRAKACFLPETLLCHRPHRSTGRRSAASSYPASATPLNRARRASLQLNRSALVTPSDCLQLPVTTNVRVYRLQAAV